MAFCKHGHDKAVVGVNKRNECKVCVARHKRSQLDKNPTAAHTRSKKWYQENKERSKELHLLRKYGITQDDFDRMLSEQQGACGICKEKMTPGKFTHVDHDHETGTVRSLLCHRCNVGIGHFQENPDLLIAAAEYLKGHKAQ